MLSFGEIASEMFVCRVLALAFPRFNKITGISPRISFSFNSKSDMVEVHLGFDVEPNEKQYSVLYEEISNAERLLMNEHLLGHAEQHDNVKQLIFKTKEDMRQIIDKQRRDA